MFISNNQSFVCVTCEKEVPRHPNSSRNHCPYCLTSLHLDIEPGDRAEQCQGVMEAIGLETKEGKIQIIFECQTCKVRRKNITAPDDDQEKLIELSTKII